MPDKAKLFIGCCTYRFQVKSPGEIGRKVNAEIFTMSKVLKWMTINIVGRSI